jgi:hypothetical protein
LINGAGAGLLGAASIPPLTGSTVGLVIALALAVAIVATFVPAIRAARQSTVAALEDAARPPRRRAWVIRLSAHLPATLLVGARLAVRRPRRLVLSVFSVAVTASGLVAVLILHASSAGWSLGPRVTQATTIVSVMLAVLAAVNAVFIAWTTVIEARHHVMIDLGYLGELRDVALYVNDRQINRVGYSEEAAERTSYVVRVTSAAS